MHPQEISLVSGCWGNWLLDAETVIYPRVLGAETSVVRRELTTGRESIVATVKGRILNPGIALSAAGESLFFARLENSESDLRWLSRYR